MSRYYLPESQHVDVLAVARRVIENPDTPVTVSPIEAYALCRHVYLANDLTPPTTPPLFADTSELPQEEHPTNGNR